MDNQNNWCIYLEGLEELCRVQMQGSDAMDYNQNKQLFKAQLFNCKNNFYGDVERNILLTKIKIVEAVQKCKQYPSPSPLTPNQKQIIDTIKTRLSVLNGDIDHLLKQGILALYMDLHELKHKMHSFSLCPALQTLLTSLIQAQWTLLKSYFIFKQYHNSKLLNDRSKQKSILSLRNINKKVQEVKTPDLIDQKLIRGVQNNLARKTIHQLIQNYMKSQEAQIKQALQICRICSNKIKLENIQRHVHTCQKKSILKQRMEENKIRMIRLLEKLKENYRQVCEKDQITEQQESFKKIAKIVLCIDKRKQRNIVRRSSLVGVNSQKNFKNAIEKVIEEYLEENGQNKALQDILSVWREKINIQKHINAIQINSLNSSNNNECESFHDMKTLSKKKQKHQGKYKESQFNQSAPKKNKKKKVQIKSDSDVSEESQKETQSETSAKILQIKTKNSLSKRKIKDNLQFDERTLVKHYVSLQDITFQSESDSDISLDRAGAFGKVYMVRRSETKDIYALKIVKFPSGCAQDQLETIRNQHEIFRKIAGDHLVKAPFSFSQRNCHIFILEYMPGGDLRKMLSQEIYFQQEKARFYLAEIVLAIEHLHKYNIIHRDLKPQNLVIDKNGHLKLTDFGLSDLQINNKLQNARKMQEDQKQQKRSRKRRTAVSSKRCGVKLIGTPDYIAPEIINGLSTKNSTIDWWSLGIMAYELLTGARPFCADTIEDVLDNVFKFNLEWPEIGYQEGMVSPEAQDLILQLLDKNFVSRLGSQGAHEIKQHPFFAGVDWDNIKYSTPPTFPQMESMRHFQELIQDSELREEVEVMIGPGRRHKYEKEVFKLQRFVRFDILGSETIENVGKIYERQTSRLKKLKTIQKLQFEQVEEILH